MNTFIDFLNTDTFAGLVVGILSSIAVWRFTTLLRPKMRITKNILLKERIGLIHIKNARRRKILNINIRLQIVKRKEKDGEIFGEASLCKIVPSNLFALSGKRRKMDIFKITNDYKLEIKKFNTILKKLDGGENKLELTISFVDSLSNMTSVMDINYDKDSVIKESEHFYKEYI